MPNADNGHVDVVLRPQGVVSIPQAPAKARGRAKCAACLLFVTALGVAACEGSTNATGVIPPVVVGMSSTAAPYYSSAELTIYWEQTPVSLPVKAGTGKEATVSPYPSSPYLLATDYQLQVDFTVTNLDNAAHNVWITMNPWNQFVRYYPGITIVSNDETEPNLPGMERPFVLQPMSRVQGTFTTDDMNDLATKLDIAMAIMAKPLGMNAPYSQAELLNHDFNVQYRTNDGDPLMAPYIPSIIAGMTGFDLGIQSYEQMNVALEVNIQLTDNWPGPSNLDPLIAPGEKATPIGPPGTLLKIPGAVMM
jgi:hypothetical protein